MSEFFEPVIVTTTGDDLTVLQSLSVRLIEARLAACVQVSAPIVSYFRWEGKIETCSEWSLAIKTSRAMYPAVQQLILDHHNYDQPQIVVVPVIDGSPGYMDWFKTQIREGFVE